MFIRRWIPELAEGAGSYPQPSVEHTAAVQQARAKIFQFRRRAEVRASIEEVVKKHGSRKTRAIRPKSRTAAQRPMSLFEDGTPAKVPSFGLKSILE